MDKADLAWFTGLYEGEGTVSCVNNGGGINLTIAMTDVEPITEALRIWDGVGSYSTWTQKSTSKAYRPMHAFRVTNRSDFTQVGMAMWPRLSLRRRTQLGEVFGRLNSVQNGKVLNPFT